MSKRFWDLGYVWESGWAIDTKLNTMLGARRPTPQALLMERQGSIAAEAIIPIAWTFARPPGTRWVFFLGKLRAGNTLHSEGRNESERLNLANIDHLECRQVSALASAGLEVHRSCCRAEARGVDFYLSRFIYHKFERVSKEYENFREIHPT